MPHFLISPARCDGARASLLLRPDGQSELASRLREPGAPIAEVFTFVSGLYFRGKLAYALAFSAGHAVRVITPDGAVRATDEPIDRDGLARLSGCAVDHRDPVYAAALKRGAASLPDGPVVLLGSVRTPKYLAPLLEALGGRLLYPAALSSLGDMQRGALLLRSANDRRELVYARPELPRRRDAPRNPGPGAEKDR